MCVVVMLCMEGPTWRKTVPIIYTVYLKILAVIKLVICLKSGRNALLAKFKFGSLLRYVIA